MEIQKQILEILQSVNREGTKNLVEYLTKECDYFTAPASTTYHGNTEGGLARHSLNVYNILKDKVDKYYPDGSISPQSVALCSLMHDLCKVDIYKWSKKWKKDENNKWFEEPCWMVKDEFPVGHGSKSVFVLQRFVQLTDEEIAAIYFHLGMCDPGVHFNYPNGFAYKDALNLYPLVVLLQLADLEASYVVERK